MWQEGVEQAANIMMMCRIRDTNGNSSQCRPVTLCQNRYRTRIHCFGWRAHGATAFCEPRVTGWERWSLGLRDEYYEMINSDECVPIGHSVNANIATLNGMMVHESAEEAMRRGIEGFKFFGYSLAHYAVCGAHRPGRTKLWRRFQAIKDDIKDTADSGSIGRPQIVCDHLISYAHVCIDQMIFIQQCGVNKREHICEARELFADEVMPALKERQNERVRRKQEELEPYKEAALARKPLMPALRETDIPNIEAMDIVLGRRTCKDYASAGGTFEYPTRAGAIPIVSRETCAKAASID
ncbi:hypothetical protein [Bradyrhizobium sp. CCGB20]|uniref:hypothetical protein n=1 Tax=Bradyrhizobium sp. CCGB20 TaxID=2949633 RepID=UPI0020B28CE5|nr:hypothetical protein [Bradyrhizobium sp. CCGB20]MCP3397000.1 hypothetical protein [Bradyrhizobium sp. CCGB20]